MFSFNFKSRKNRASLIAAASFAAASSLLFSAAANAQESALSSVPGVPWAAVDDYGREVVAQDAPDLRENKTVGLFYFLWQAPGSGIVQDKKNRTLDDPGPYDLTKILKVHPNPVQDDSVLGNNGEMHFWGEPLYGYYDSRDPWVVRRHMQLIADAGVDVLLFDTTNMLTYPEVYLPLCDLLLEMKAEGERVPQLTFITNTRLDVSVAALWKDFYSQKKYEPLFFLWEGKPLLLADPKDVPKKYRDKFTFRAAYWPTNGLKNTRDKWQWIANYPQTYSWTKDEDTPEEVNVSTAQNLSRDDEGRCVWMSMDEARGRSFVYGAEKQVDAPDLGLNFAQQWLRAYELDPPFVMITGWNEWIAGRWYVPYQDPVTKEVKQIYTFVDQYNYEYSRDVEPNRACDHVDSYYLQMVDGIRKYKGASKLTQTAPRKTIDLGQGFDQWSDVEPTFRDHLHENEPRDFDGVGGTHYKNDSGRNDLAFAKVARDDDNLYVYVETKDEIKPALPNNLCVAIDVDGDLKSGWRGADLLVGRQYSADGTVSAETYAQTEEPRWSTKETLKGARWSLEGNKLQLAIPLELIAADKTLDAISFKVLDAVPLESPADLYDQGDVAPESAFFYAVKFEK